MNTDAPAAVRLAALEAHLKVFDQVAVAVSGGVDSLTLAAVTHGRLGARAAMFHAMSPAVPAEERRSSASSSPAGTSSF